MKVILQQDVRNLGDMGDIVRVKDGYARNYLLPRGMAIIANEKNMSLSAWTKTTAMVMDIDWRPVHFLKSFIFLWFALGLF